MDEFPLGTEVIFTPFTNLWQDGKHYKSWEENSWIIPKEIRGTVCCIHRAHGWFRVRYEAFGHTQYECFRLYGERGKYFPRPVGKNKKS